MEAKRLNCINGLNRRLAQPHLPPLHEALHTPKELQHSFRLSPCPVKDRTLLMETCSPKRLAAPSRLVSKYSRADLPEELASITAELSKLFARTPKPNRTNQLPFRTNRGRNKTQKREITSIYSPRHKSLRKSGLPKINHEFESLQKFYLDFHSKSKLLVDKLQKSLVEASRL